MKEYKMSMGITSSIWHAKAKNIDVATVAIMVYLGTDAEVENLPMEDRRGQTVEQSQFYGLSKEVRVEEIGKWLDDPENAAAVKTAVATVDRQSDAEYLEDLAGRW